MSSYTYATVCSGVEGCSLALAGMDWQPIFFAEIEPFPCAVLKARYPKVPNLGDMSKITYNKQEGIITNGKRTVQFHGRLDLLAGGTPCQDFSVAGKRAGGGEGSGTRSSLCWEWLRLVSEFRPRVILWENVVGCLSSNGGRDFSQLVATLGELGYCCGWRVLDSKHTRLDKWPMGVPQRRRRLFLVGCFGANVDEIGKVLFEPKFVIGDTAPRRKTQNAKASIPGATPDSNRKHDGVAPSGVSEFVGCFDQSTRARNPLPNKDLSPTLLVSECNTPIVVTVAYENHAQDSRVKELKDEVSPTLSATSSNNPLSGNNPLIVTGLSNGQYIIRRLTPLETERLMGYPEGHTIPRFEHITDELVEEFVKIHNDFKVLMNPGKAIKPAAKTQVREWLEKISNPETCPDAPRYKACGNGWAINCARWVLQGVDRYLRKQDEKISP